MFTRNLFRAGLLLAIMAGLLLAILNGAPVGATGDETPDWTVRLDDKVVRGDYHSRYPLGFPWPPAELVGQNCSAVAKARNNGSVHPESDIFIVSGYVDNQERIWLRDVEREAGAKTVGEGAIEFLEGEQVGIWVILGPDEVFSGGIRVDFYCDPPELTEYLVFMPIVNAPAEPPPTPVCDGEIASVAITNKYGEQIASGMVPFVPMPAPQWWVGLLHEGDRVDLSYSREVELSVSNISDGLYHKFNEPVATASFVANWPNIDPDNDVWGLPLSVLRTHRVYLTTASFVDANGKTCLSPNGAQWDPPETRAIAADWVPEGFTPLNLQR